MSPAILVLVAQDEEAIRHLLEDALTEAGFELVMGADGQQALSELEGSSQLDWALAIQLEPPAHAVSEVLPFGVQQP